MSCLLCSENESISHLCFVIVVLLSIWNMVAQILQWNIGSDFKLVARFWLCGKSALTKNLCTSAILWSLWKSHNVICSQGECWKDVRMILKMAAKMIGRWHLPYKLHEWRLLEGVLSGLEEKAREHLRISWQERWKRIRRLKWDDNSSKLQLGRCNNCWEFRRGFIRNQPFFVSIR